MEVKFEISLRASVEKEGAWYIASCPALDVHSQGKTERKALRNLYEALRLFIESCWERGTLDAVLKNEGFKKKSVSRSTASRTLPHTVSIPLVLASGQHAPAHAH